MVLVTLLIGGLDGSSISMSFHDVMQPTFTNIPIS